MTFLRRKFDMQERSTSKNKSVASDAAKKAKKRRRLYFSTPVAVGEDDFKKFPATYEKVMMPNVKQQPHHGGQSTSDLKKKVYFTFFLVLLCNFIEITLRHGCSPINLLHIFRATFPTNTSARGLLLVFYILVNSKEVFCLLFFVFFSLL